MKEQDHEDFFLLLGHAVVQQYLSEVSTAVTEAVVPLEHDLGRVHVGNDMEKLICAITETSAKRKKVDHTWPRTHSELQNLKSWQAEQSSLS